MNSRTRTHPHTHTQTDAYTETRLEAFNVNINREFISRKPVDERTNCSNMKPLIKRLKLLINDVCARMIICTLCILPI